MIYVPRQLFHRVLISVVALVFLYSPAAAARRYYMLLGSRLSSFEQPPLVQQDGRSFINLAVLDDLGLSAGAPQGGTAVSAPGDDNAPGMSAPEQLKYKLLDQLVGVSPAGDALSVSVNSKPLPAVDLLEAGGARYLSAAQFAKLGLELSYDAAQDLPQLVGRIYKVDYSGTPPSLSLSALTPLLVRSLPKVDDSDRPPEDARSLAKTYGQGGSRQPSDSPIELTTFVVEGGRFAKTDNIEPKNTVMTRLGFKNVEGMGRGLVFARQPQRTGFKINSDDKAGFARITFGNYFQLASYRQTSSGEISINIQLGAPAKHTEKLLADPARLVLDFSGCTFDEASKTIKVGIGAVQNIRVGAPSPGNVRVVLDLSQAVDYRILSKEKGARLFVQLLPHTSPNAPSTKSSRLGRAIMLDAGHGGRDVGAEGAISGTNEKSNTLAITKLVKRELEALGYTVVLTRQDDRFVSLGQRGDYANSLLPYVFVSIHCNAMPGKPEHVGAMTFHHTYSSPDAVRLAESVQGALIAATGAEDKGVRDADFFVLRETIMPAILIETGFMTNPGECKQLADKAYQAKLAHGIASGIDAYVSSSD